MKSTRRRDFLEPAARSALMSRIKGKGTKPELALARLLRRECIRFRRHVKTLPGRPDFVLQARKIAIFVDGGFWHGRNLEQLRPTLKPYWVQKIERNIVRDRSTRAKLRCMGWSVLRIWEEDALRQPEKCLSRIQRAGHEDRVKGRESLKAR
jgi:DNA mismatch endonuclease (patch repair protein)